MPETLTAEEVQEFRDMRDAWSQMQAALKMGTADRPTRDGHGHRDNVVRERGSGTPTHTAKQGTFYHDTTNKKMFVNDSGTTAWTELGGGVVAGGHELFSTTHTDTDTTASGKLRGQIAIVNSVPEWDQLNPGTLQSAGTDAVLGTVNGADPVWVNLATKAIAAVPFRLVIPLGSDRQGQMHNA